MRNKALAAAVTADAAVYSATLTYSANSPYG